MKRTRTVSPVKAVTTFTRSADRGGWLWTLSVGLEGEEKLVRQGWNVSQRGAKSDALAALESASVGSYVKKLERAESQRIAAAQIAQAVSRMRARDDATPASSAAPGGTET